ncbi:MAG: hypothetical protein WC155_05980 [Candidatus Cloacimonadales bacterium]
MKEKMTLKEERKAKALKVKKIIETPINYTLKAQVCRLKLQQPTP